MRNVLSLFRRTARRPHRPPNAGWYRSESCPGQIREQQFHRVRRGLDPVEVHAFLHRVAAELANARRDLALTTEENVRIKRALRSWQSRFTPGARW
ncbi:DivIVA domain-containing protein [Micromonospora purpureochromogenes]|uniref:DivIVA domain-containing protein n=1 Tax=Micromonospora purpureochromogenes TaxID=47872 RepID=UPI0033D62FAE